MTVRDGLRPSGTHSNISSAVAQSRPSILDVLAKLEQFYGPQDPSFPTDPYEFLVWWHCGYPASDAACEKGWKNLKQQAGIEPQRLLAVKPAQLAAALRPGGMVPELRAERIKEIARRVQDEFGGDLRAALSLPLAKARKILKSFSGIADPGADRILLFAGIAPLAAVPSNCVHVLIRIMEGPEGENYSASYREAQRAIAGEVPEKFDARIRAYLLLKTHGQQTCKRTNPKCQDCPVKAKCAFVSRG
jgi:endonuclease III